MIPRPVENRNQTETFAEKNQTWKILISTHFSSIPWYVSDEHVCDFVQVFFSFRASLKEWRSETVWCLTLLYFFAIVHIQWPEIVMICGFLRCSHSQWLHCKKRKQICNIERVRDKKKTADSLKFYAHPAEMWPNFPKIIPKICVQTNNDWPDFRNICQTFLLPIPTFAVIKSKSIFSVCLCPSTTFSNEKLIVKKFSDWITKILLHISFFAVGITRFIT